MTVDDKTLKNNELTKLIGRRLRDSVGRGDGAALPIAIEEGLATLRQAEARLRTSGAPIIDIKNTSVSERHTEGDGGPKGAGSDG